MSKDNQPTPASQNKKDAVKDDKKGRKNKTQDDLDEASEESFPASDPPASY